MDSLIKIGGISMIIGGVFLILTNVLLTPFLDFNAPFSQTAGSGTYLYRMICAAITVFFLLLSTPGLYLFQSKNMSRNSIIPFLIAFAGSAFLLANEWYQIFIFPDLAGISPDALDNLDSSGSFTGYDIGALIAITTFALGWIIIAISLLRTKIVSIAAPALIIAGFFLTPLLSTAFAPSIAGAIGNTVLGIGFILLGYKIIGQSISLA